MLIYEYEQYNQITYNLTIISHYYHVQSAVMLSINQNNCYNFDNLPMSSFYPLYMMNQLFMNMRSIIIIVYQKHM